MSNGVTLEMSLYYRDGASQKVPVGAPSITTTPGLFTSNTNMVDFSVKIPAVKASDAWVGQNIGIRFLSTVGFDLAVGYWDLDNVRLKATREPDLEVLGSTNGLFEFVMLSEPGLGFEIQATTNLTAASSDWLIWAALTNFSGATCLTDTETNLDQRYYRAKELP